jgi:hypothetical protein
MGHFRPKPFSKLLNLLESCASLGSANEVNNLDCNSQRQKQLCLLFVYYPLATSALAEQVEARLAAGEKIDIAEYAQLAATLVRISSRIGIDRRARTASSTSGLPPLGSTKPR